MEKEKREDQNNLNEEGSPQIKESDDQSSDKGDKDIERKNPEEKIVELEEKLVRQLAEMENQRRRYEKEK